MIVDNFFLKKMDPLTLIENMMKLDYDPKIRKCSLIIKDGVRSLQPNDSGKEEYEELMKELQHISLPFPINKFKGLSSGLVARIILFSLLFGEKFFEENDITGWNETSFSHIIFFLALKTSNDKNIVINQNTVSIKDCGDSISNSWASLFGQAYRIIWKYLEPGFELNSNQRSIMERVFNLKYEQDPIGYVEYRFVR